MCGLPAPSTAPTLPAAAAAGRPLASALLSVAAAPRRGAALPSLLAQLREQLEEEPSPSADPCGDLAPRVEPRAWLFEEVLAADLPAVLLSRLPSLDFEARKDAMRAFGALLRLGGTAETFRKELVGYIEGRPEILRLLLEGLHRPETTVVCGEMLRECARHGELVRMLLEGSGAAERLLSLARHDEVFDVAVDAFATLKELFTQQKAVAACYVLSNFDGFFQAYHGLLDCDYILQRQALRFLAEMLLDVAFQEVMLRYINCARNLKLHLTLLRGSSAAVRLGAFHVVKVFAGNPEMPRDVELLLSRNANKLCRLFELLPLLLPGDEALAADVSAVVTRIAALPGAEVAEPSRPEGRGLGGGAAGCPCARVASPASATCTTASAASCGSRTDDTATAAEAFYHYDPTETVPLVGTGAFRPPVLRAC